MKILVIAPHPDDEVLGCGGTIKKYANQGDNVYLCVVTKAYTPDWSRAFISGRKKEVQKANEILGIKKTFFLDLPTAKLDTVGQKKLNDMMSEVFFKVNPDVVYIPFGTDLNKDHRLVFEAGLVVTRPKHAHNTKRVLCYEVLSETEWGSFLARKKEDVFVPNVYVDIFSTMQDKIKAMSCYQSEVKKFPHPRSLESIKVMAKKRGAEAGLKAAEAFMLIREIRPIA